jgi:HD-like signal output (HDOD) protein/CheY-like chemotaxis protein
VIRILFVDDDAQILDGIRRSTHCMRSEWSMRFTSSAAAALLELSTQPADVVVTDMRMPGMNGSEFLAEVKRLYPETVRIVLSGQAETDSILRVTRSAHRYLSKPCDAATLKAAIARTTNLKAALSNEHLAAIVGTVDALPTPPKTYQELLTCLRDPESAISDVARIIRQDVAMTAKILKLANSGFFGLREPVQTVDRAVALMGMEAISSLVLGQELFDSKSPISMPGFSLEYLGKHSFETAAWARAVALDEKCGARLADAAFLAGVLHDVGRLVFATRRAPVSSSERDSWIAQNALEMEEHHAAVGGYLLGLWSFPEAIVEAIVWHHTPSKCAESGLGLCGLLHVGDYLAHAHEQQHPESTPKSLEPGYLEALGLADRMSAWEATRAANE